MATPTFALGTFAHNGAAAFPGLVVNEHVSDLRPHFGPHTSTLQLLEAWDANLPRLQQLAADATDTAQPIFELHPCAPIVPRQILCAGANYHRHIVQMAFAHLRRQNDGRSDDELRHAAEDEASELANREPFLFAGIPSALCGAHDDIILWGPGTQHDWELELAVIIGRGGRNITPEDAMDHIAGYTVANDITVRDQVARGGNFPYSDLIAAKNRPTYFPTGPYIVPRSAVPDPSQLRLTLRVNGQVMQDETTADLIHTVDKLIAYASRTVELYPGDLLLTGSPAGNAAHHANRWLQPGDLIEAEITNVGTQHNHCVVPDPTSSDGAPR